MNTQVDEYLTPGKTSFDHVYDQPDPQSYFETLGLLEYQIPEHGCSVFDNLLDVLRRRNGHAPLKVVDLCCSYGINAALLNHRLELEDLYRYYRSPKRKPSRNGEAIKADRRYFEEKRLPDPISVVGVDAAGNAIRYALDVGLLDDGFAENLEHEEASPELRASVAGAQLIIVTGGIGYITERTLEKIISAVDAPVWLAAFVLRIVSYDRFEELLARHGLATEKHEATFPQRRFNDQEEKRYALEELARIGKDPRGKESKGYYHTELYLSRPEQEVAEVPLERLLIIE